MIQGKLNNISFTGISIDTRTLVPGNLFFAIQGNRIDGHDCLEEAKKKGATLAIVARDISTQLPYIKVNDVIQTLGNMAEDWRGQFSLPIIGLTGSNGKTTTKNMLAAIFQQTQQPVLATQGNFNNAIGLPLTLARLNHTHQYAVIEMGMNHLGEIAYLSQLTKPTLALITNVGLCHLAGVGEDITKVAKAKGEIFEGLQQGGTAVMNADDPFTPYWKQQLSCRQDVTIMTFGLNIPASMPNSPDVQGKTVSDTSHNAFLLSYQNQSILIRLALLGQHNVYNALAAATVALAHQVSLAQIKVGLEAVLPEKGRMEIAQHLQTPVLDCLIINDAYNANPNSLKAAITAIQTNTSIDFVQRTKILVLGDMGELGTQAVALHENCGQFAKENGIDFLFATGNLTQYAVIGFGKNGQFYKNKQLLIQALCHYLQHAGKQQKILMLVKGSRLMAMETIIEQLIQVLS